MAQALVHDILQHLGPLPPPQSALEKRTSREQQLLLVSQSLTMGVVNILNGLLAICLFLSTTPHWRLALWYAPVLAFGVLQINLWQRLHKRRAPTQISGRFLRRVEMTALGLAAIWGAALFILPTDSRVGPLLTLVVLQCGMAAGAAALLTPLPRVVLRFSGTCVTLMIAGLLWHGQPEGLFLILPALAYLGSLYAASLVSHRQMVRLHRAQTETEQARTDLADAIESVDGGFAIISPTGEIVLTNSRHDEWFGYDTAPEITASAEPVIMPDGAWVISSLQPMSNGGRVWVHSDVTALKRRERELVDARREAELADETKSRFMNTMSHELRTPLNLIIGFSKMISQSEERALSEAELKEYSAHIHASAEQLLRLINDIIDYSRSGLDDFGFESSIVPIDELVDDAMRRARLAVPEAEDVRFDVRIAEGLSSFEIDERTVLKVLDALLSNAIKFRGRNPDIVVRVGVAGDGRPFLTVRDFGIGMSPVDAERAFEAFFQASNQLGREYNGAGLGLTVARQLARLHGGDIILKSRINAGTAATLVLPRSALPDEEQSRRSDHGDLLDLAS